MKSIVSKLSTKNKVVEREEVQHNGECHVNIICHSSFVFEIMGLQYFKVYKVNHENYQTGPSKANYIRMILILLSILSLAISYSFFFAPNLNMNLRVETNMSLKNLVNVMINYVLQSLFVMVIVSGILQSFLTTKSYKKFVLNLKDMIGLIPKDLNVNKDFENFRKRVTFRRCTSALIFISLHIIAGYFYYMVSVREFIVRTILSFIPTMFLVVVTLKIVFVVHLTTHFLELLKKILQNMRNSEQKDFEKITIESILTCRKIYNKIYENSEFINQKFGLTILCAILTFVICITVSGYEMFLIFTQKVHFGELMSVVHPNIQCTLLLSAIVFNCQRAKTVVSLSLQ